MHAGLPTRRRMRSLIAVVAAAASLIVLAPAAEAQSTGLRDRVGDGSERNNDITNVTLAHRDRMVLVKVRTRTGPLNSLHVLLDLNARSRFDFRVAWYDEDADEGWPGRAYVMTRRGHYRCSARVRFLDDDRVLFVAVPRSCMGGPNRVRARARTFPNIQGSNDPGWGPSDTTGWTRFVRRG